MDKSRNCVCLIGMPGAGKSTIGTILASMLGYAFVDTDLLLEALYARRLQDVTEALTRDEFLDAEAAVILSLRARKSVIATGGSVIYRHAAMRCLQELGSIVHLAVPLQIVTERVARTPERGISFGPGQGLADIYAERSALYAKYADFVCDTSAQDAQACAQAITAWLAEK